MTCADRRRPTEIVRESVSVLLGRQPAPIPRACTLAVGVALFLTFAPGSARAQEDAEDPEPAAPPPAPAREFAQYPQPAAPAPTSPQQYAEYPQPATPNDAASLGPAGVLPHRADAADPGKVARGFGTVLVWTGLLVAAVSIGSVRQFNSPGGVDESTADTNRLLFLMTSAGLAMSSGGFALRVMGHGARYNANVRAGYVPSRTMAGPKTWLAIGGTMALAGMGMAATGVADKSDGLALGGAVLASGGAFFVALLGDGLASRITYAMPEAAPQSPLTVRPWLAPMVSSLGSNPRNAAGVAAGLMGSF